MFETNQQFDNYNPELENCLDENEKLKKWIKQLEAELLDKKETEEITKKLRKQLIKDGLLNEKDDDVERIKQLEKVINKVFAFRISSSFAENVNELAILQNKLQKTLANK